MSTSIRNLGVAAALRGEEGERVPSARWALASLSLPVLLASLGTSVANVGSPDLAVAFHASYGEIQWVVLSYLLAVTTLVVGAGRLGDLTGRRRLLLAGIHVFTAASAVCGLAPSLGTLIAARAAQGLGAAVLMALTLALVADSVPEEASGRALGLLGTMSAIGTALGPSLGGALLAGPGWRALFLVQVPVGLLAAHLGRRHLPEDRPSQALARPPFDLTGTLLLATTLAAYALAMTLGSGRPGALGVSGSILPIGSIKAALLLAAALGAAAFAIAQSRAASPLVPLALLRDPALAAGLATNALVSTVLMTTLVIGPFFLSRSLGLEAASLGLVLSVGPLVVAACGAPAGRLVDRLGTRRTTLAGLGGIAGGAALLTLVPTLSPGTGHVLGANGVPGYVAAIAVLTAGYALFQTANGKAVMTGTPPDRRGSVSGLLNLSRNLGLVTAASVVGAVFTFASGAADVATASPAAVATGTRGAFAFCTASMLVALAVAARAPSGAAPMFAAATAGSASSPRAGRASAPERGSLRAPSA